MVDIYHFKSCTVRISGDLVTTTFLSDRSTVKGYPQAAEEYEAKARALGYANGAEMNREHDVWHARLSDWLDLEHSPTLWMVAGHGDIPGDLSGAEENAVLALSAYYNALMRHGLV